MEISFTELKEKEVINVFDGKKLGRIVDILFDCISGEVKGIVVPGERKLFHKNEDLFVPLNRLKKIGNDVILVGLGKNFANKSKGTSEEIYMQNSKRNLARENAYLNFETHNNCNPERLSYVRFKRLDNKKYK